MTDGTAVQEIERITREAAGKTVEIDGRVYSTTLLHDPRKRLPEPDVLGVSRLLGIADYVEHNRDELDLSRCVLHVEEPGLVNLYGHLRGEFQQRPCYVRASTICGMGDFRFGEYLDAESMIVALQSRFVETDERAKILRLLGNVREEAVKTSADDGVSQSVTARMGVASVENVKVPSPVRLAPRRTFYEVEQPVSPFIFRLHYGPSAALHEADGGAWRGEAIERIGSWLREHVAEVPVIA